MICTKCGTENNEGAKFCKNCGSPLEASPAKKPPVKLIAILCGLAAVAAVTAALVLTHRPTINLNKYIDFSTSGYDGYGKISYSVDWDKIEKDYEGKLKFTSKAKDYFSKELLGELDPVDVICDNTFTSLSSYDGLSNGDEVSYSWEIGENLEDMIKVKIKADEGTYAVTGLKKVDKIDAFEGLDVTFSGFAPDGTASIEYTGSAVASYEFSLDKTTGLSNGDTVTVSLYSDDPEYYINNYDGVPAEQKKEFTVSGLSEYLGSYADLSDATVDKLKEDSEDAVYAYVASDYSDDSSLSEIEYAGYIFLKRKDDGYSTDRNILYIIYKGTLSHAEGDFDTTDVYFPVKYSNITREGDEQKVGDESGIQGYSDLGSWWYSTKGYTNPVSAYVDFVEANRDTYTSEVGGGFEKFADYESVTSLKDITAEQMDAFSETVKGKVESYIAKDYSDECKAESLSLAGEYLLIAKNQGTDLKNNNKLIMVYSAVVTHEDDDFEKTTVYFPVTIDGVTKLGNEYISCGMGDIQGTAYFTGTWYYTKGYIEGEKMFSDLVTAQRNTYDYEMSDGLKTFGE
ncbi:zinc ribbon domain-containing protein [Butyrivibrio sp. MC2013]|uniref:zinc ribbon domain-containing protein n=1 Tax=Butyrivibrio sp. MC2013 TaxID=1280686 RepID=UPI0004067FE6|nr:zinc ribbon domain-containing protein [Butyrivibrio sp. MC2013]